MPRAIRAALAAVLRDLADVLDAQHGPAVRINAAWSRSWS